MIFTGILRTEEGFQHRKLQIRPGVLLQPCRILSAAGMSRSCLCPFSSCAERGLTRKQGVTGGRNYGKIDVETYAGKNEARRRKIR